MNYPSDIAELEAELERVQSIVERDETAMARSQRPQIEKLFLCSSRKLQQDLRDRLRQAKAGDFG